MKKYSRREVITEIYYLGHRNNIEWYKADEVDAEASRRNRSSESTLAKLGDSQSVREFQVGEVGRSDQVSRPGDRGVQ